MFQSYIRKVSDDSDLLGVQNCYKFLIESSETGTVLGKPVNPFTAWSQCSVFATHIRVS
jgi:hypothetical protein